jgi:hypothetical protein
MGDRGWGIVERGEFRHLRQEFTYKKVRGATIVGAWKELGGGTIET